MSANSPIDRVIGVGWGLSPHASLFNLLTAQNKLQSVLNFGQNVSWRSNGSHTCWSVRYPVNRHLVTSNSTQRTSWECARGYSTILLLPWCRWYNCDVLCCVTDTAKWYSCSPVCTLGNYSTTVIYIEIVFFFFFDCTHAVLSCLCSVRWVLGRASKL